jgi:hypothetical protein
MEQGGREEDRAGDEEGAVILTDPVSEEAEERYAEQKQAGGSGDEGEVFLFHRGRGVRVGNF